MGMTGGLYRASEAEIEALLAEPETAGEFIERSIWAPPVKTVRPKGLFGWLLRLTPITIQENDPTAVRPPDFQDRPHCDLEKTWHGLHFLFTGTAWEGRARLLPGPRCRRDRRRRSTRLQRATGAASRQDARLLGVP